MESLIDVMRRRKNWKHFLQDEYPSKEEIEILLQEAHELIPQKNNVYRFKIDIYGPEYKEEKEEFLLLTGTGKEEISKERLEENSLDIDIAREYDTWLQNPILSEKQLKKPKQMYNFQVMAPYLLVYTEKDSGYITPSQKLTFSFKYFNEENLRPRPGNFEWYIGASMHGFGLSLLANARNIDASFCKCFKYYPNNRIVKEGTTTNQIAFTLSLGYRKQNYDPPLKQSMSKYNEHIKWM